MTIEEAKALIDDMDYVGGLKNRIPRGFEIMSKYYDDIEVYAEHDEMWAGPQGDEMKIEEWSEEDIREMGKYGWNIDSETDSWHHFT